MSIDLTLHSHALFPKTDDGRLSREEFQAFLGHELPDDEVNALFNEIDTDRSNSISVEELSGERGGEGNGERSRSHSAPFRTEYFRKRSEPFDGLFNGLDTTNKGLAHALQHSFTVRKVWESGRSLPHLSLTVFCLP